MSKNKENYLKPLVKIDRGKRHAAFDIESNNWTRFEMAGYFDGYDYRQFNSITDLIDRIAIRRNAGRIIFAHNGGRFDFLFLVDYLKRTDKKLKLICQGSRITGLKIEVGKREYITLQDSYAILPASLEKLCQAFKPTHAKLTGSIDFAKERVDKNNPKHRAYLEADCRSLWEIIEIYKHLPYIEDIGVRMTTASTAMAAWRTTLKSPIKITPKHVQNFVRKAYAGGRCEIFRQVMGEGQCVDANSLYPTMMLKPLPIEVIGESNDADDFGFHDVSVTVPDQYMPILWVKTPKLIFPTGNFRGVFFSEEIKAAIQNGAKILRHHKGFRFSKRDDLFKDFITTCYKLRLENKGTALDLIGKLLMNSCYGKFAEREEKRSLIKLNQLDPASWPKEFSMFRSEKLFKETGLVEIIKHQRTPHMLCHIAAAITAYGRIFMAEKIYIPFQDSIHYTDTDSGMINGEIKTGTELGEFKQEYPIKQGFFLLPKGYWIETKNGEIIRKLKGFSKKSLESITYEMFKKGNIKATEKKLGGFRSALIRENQFLALLDHKKSVISEYNKRKILPGGNTRPWNLNKGETR